MNDSAVSRHTVSFGVALAVASVVNGIIVIAKESSKQVMDGMKAVTGHHWTTHSAVVILLFLVVGWALGRLNGGQGLRMTAGRLLGTVLAGVTIGGLLIVGFYLIGD